MTDVLYEVTPFEGTFYFLYNLVIPFEGLYFHQK